MRQNIVKNLFFLMQLFGINKCITINNDKCIQVDGSVSL